MSALPNLIDSAGLTALADAVGEDAEETSGIQQLGARAHAFLAEHSWCRSVLESHVGIAIPGVVGVFLARIVPSSDAVDEWLWVVVGDVPPAYLVIDDSPHASGALRTYVNEMRRWIHAVETGGSFEDVIPVNAPATSEFAIALRSRLDFLERKVAPEYS